MSGPPQAPRNMDDLLKWSIAQSGGAQAGTAGDGDASGIRDVASDIAAGRRPDLADPGLYSAIMGKSDGQMMREELTVALDSSRNEQDRVTALDNFEMLIEQIDNANNMTNMKMWAPLIALLDGGGGGGGGGDNESASAAPVTTSPPIQVAALWILGTAVQNNDKAQMAILDYDPLRPILHLLAHGVDGQVRSKALYALSGILKHNPKAVDLFGKQSGWPVLRGALLDPDVSLRRKAAFLVNTLLFQDDSAARQAEPAVPSSSNLAPRSTSTALAPLLPASAQPSANAGATRDNASADLPPMPLEQPPATMRSGVPHPSIPPQLVASHLLNTLIVSLLPVAVQSKLPGGLDAAAPAAGPDGDIELRDDLDYAEKGVRACLTLVEKLTGEVLPAKGSAAAVAWTETDAELRTQAHTLLQALAHDLRGPPVDASEGPTSRWQELGLDAAEVDAFDAGVKAL